MGDLRLDRVPNSYKERTDSKPSHRRVRDLNSVFEKNEHKPKIFVTTPDSVDGPKVQIAKRKTSFHDKNLDIQSA
jgi:hypothetical protein